MIVKVMIRKHEKAAIKELQVFCKEMQIVHKMQCKFFCASF
jgi:hypothetical protein